jgi:hypothetical protein
MQGKHEKPTTFKMGVVLDPKTYDPLKQLALVGLPAFSALYFGLGQIWGWPKIEEVVGSIAVLDTVLGTLLGISSSNYKKLNEEAT